MEPQGQLDECCYRAVFSDQTKRIGRCHYRCDWCGKDVSLLWAFYMMSKDGEKEDHNGK